MPKPSFKSVIQKRSHGLRYFDQACAKLGRDEVIKQAIDLQNKYGNGIHWAIGNVVLKAIEPNYPPQSYWLQEALTQKELDYLRSQCKNLNAWDIETPDFEDRTGELPSDEEILEAQTKALAATKAEVTEVENTSGKSTEELLKEAFERLPQDDYGYVFWNPSTKTVWYTSGDGGVEDPEEIENILRVSGVENIVFACEEDPEEEGWIPIHEETLVEFEEITLNEFLAGLQKTEEDVNEPLPEKKPRQLNDWD